ncbi:GTP-binding protein REM 2 [Hemicordylus capensis]|uniref:GTP-binding protein REM 2 n=1 Tax=Hemicordylus capensis TaxID=884348 RepID=UPI002302CE3E|nr:GTP-binding protein REM 2 [Hemicordylus capensis]XP_053121984.1 GTP-binding protein REM 2 [Hemicordylus capensis]XP_053121985.1 GTP-binding protein REM 2 [Hemicordylus capensis]
MALPSALMGAGPRRGSMPLPIKHQLVRASAVDELDSPPSSPEVGGNGGASPAGGRGPYKVMLLGESGVGKTTLAAIFGGLKGGAHHDEEHAEDSYERRFCVDDEEVTLILYDIWDQGDPGGWMQESCLQTGDAFLVVFSVTDRRSFTRVPPTLLRLRAGSPRTDPPIILVGNKSDLARSREVSREEGRSLAVMLNCKHIETSAALHHNTQELFEGAVRQIRLRRHRREGDHFSGEGAGGRRESLTKKAKRFLSSLVPRNGRFFKQRSKSCNDLSVL